MLDGELIPAKGKVSLIVTVFNEEEFVSQMLDSYLSQSYSDIEIIVVNDGSTDNTKAILEHYAQEHQSIQVINLDLNQGKVKSQNIGFEKSIGEYIAISGGDDFACYSRIKTQVEHLVSHKLDFVASNLYMVDSNNHCLINSPVFYKTEPETYNIDRVMLGRGFPGGTILFTRNLAEKIYPIPDYLPYEDLWFNFIAVIYAKIGYLHEPLGFYRQTGRNSFGLFTSQSYNHFRDRYYSLHRRTLIYLDAMKSYLIDCDIWDDHLHSSYSYSKDRLELVSARESPLQHILNYLIFIRSHYKKVNLIQDLSLLIPESKVIFIYLFRFLNK